MKKSRDINTSKFMSIVKSGRNKRIAAATTAVLLTGAVIVSSVFGSTQAAENADTLMGIEKLRNQFSEGNEYTVLEIVPDINAAEIGYLFDGYEPVLSEWDSGTMMWKSWKDILCSFDTKAERKEFMKKKAEALGEYYVAQGIEDNFPVTIPNAEEYDDSEDYINGYEEVEASSNDMTGYFSPVINDTGKYYVSFEYISYENIVKQPDAVYYTSGTAKPILSADMNIADGTYVYKVDGALYQCVGTWGEIKDSITIPSTSEEKVSDDDDKDSDDKKNDDENGDGENVTGDDDSTTGGDGNGDGENETGDDGSVDGGNESEESNNEDNENSNSGADNVDGNNGNDSDNNGSNGNTGSNGGNNINNESINTVNMVSSSTGANNALGNSFAHVKWVKYVSTDDDNTKTSDKDSSSDKKENNSGEDNNSNENKNDSSTNNDQSGESGNSSDNSQSDNSDNNTGNDNGDASGDNSGDNQDDNTGDNTGDNKGDESGDNTGDNKGDKPGDNTGDNKGDKPGDNTGDNKEDESGDNTGNNTEDESGDNSDDDQGDGSEADSDEDKKGSDKDSDKNSGEDNSIVQTAQAQGQNDSYYVVYFERATNIDALSTTGAYVVNSIRPAKLSNYGIENEYYTGQYDFVEDKDDENTQTYTFPGRILYCKEIFHNNEWFKQYVINMNKENFDNFNVRVITLTPEMLNSIYAGDVEEYEQGTIPDFDFLYLNSGLRHSEIDITDPSGEDMGNAPKPDKDEGTDADKTGDDDNTGDNGDADETGDDDNGDTDKTGDDDKAGDNGDDDKSGDDGDTDKTGDNGDTDKTGDDDSTVDNGDDDKTGDNGDADNTGNTDNSGAGGNTGDNGSTGNSADDNNTGDNTNTGNNSNTGNSDNSNNSDSNKNAAAAENKSSESKTNNINNSSYSSKSSLWKAFVSKDAADNKADDNSTGNTGNAGNTGSTENQDNTDTTGDTNNNGTSAGGSNNGDITDDTNGNDDTKGDVENKDDNTGDAENKDDNIGGSDNKDNTDDTDGDTTGDATNPDNSEEGNGDGESDKEDPSSDSDNKTENKSDSSIVLYSTASDLDAKVTNLLFKTVSAKALPCLVDGSILYGKTEGSGAITDKLTTTDHTEVFRLAAMLCQETLEKDYTSLSKENLMKGIVEDADKNYTTEQVYCRLGNGDDSIINDNFFNYTIYKEGGDVEEGFQNVLDEIKLENLYRESDSSGKYKPLPTNIAQAEAVRHILNYQNRRSVDPKKSIKVLEIQPAYTTKPELDKKQIQKWAPGVEEVETTIMTTAEFIGKIDKLNEIYDLIYIGTSKEHLNISNWVTDTGKSKDNKYLGSTVFNDSDMDGLIYYNVGDKRVVNLPMSGLLDSEYKSGNGTGRTYYYNFARYSGNDITKEKKEALISFLDGSYPIVVSDEFIEQPVTVFEDEEYAGRRATLNVGEYKEQDLLDNQIFAASGTPAKGISSIQVKKGYQITLFEQDNFKGKSITITENVNNLTTSKVEGSGQTWNNRCRSAIVDKVEDAQPVRKLDGNHIDNSSYLYDFVNTAMEKKYNNFYAYGDIDENGSEIFKFYLNRPKADLAEFTANGFIGGSYDGSTTFNDVYYIYPNTLGKYTLQYSFTIKNEGAASVDTQYDCKLYIDVNADGKFSGNEMFSDITILNRQTGGIVSKDDKGIYHLYADVPYTITRDVPDGYKGLLPWNVEVCQVNNDNIYASEQGYTKLSGMETETLKICQINKNTTNEYRIIDLNYEVETKGRYFNTLVYGGDYDGVHYSGITDDFELDIESINISTFEDYYNPSSENYNPDYLKDFNMLILGFSDAYDDFSGDPNNSKTALGAVIEFIDSGKSVLMGHDNTSYWNNPIVDGTQMGYTDRRSNDLTSAYKPDTRFAANINAYIRPLVGMDRYGVLSSSVVKRGVSLKKDASGWSELISSGKDIAYKPKSGRTETVPEAQGFTSTIINVRDTDEKSVEKRDYTKYNLYSNDYNNRSDFSNKYLSQRYDTVYYSEKSSDNGEINTETSSQNTSGKVQNVHVTQVNKGQITEYPYKLKEDFEVGQTHGQYYQLDYTADDDADGQSDLVVWYCLGARTSGSGKTDTIYSQSPNDVRNNYYIYNKGNITYTGMGHGANDRSDKAPYAAYTFEEAKLFINTIIASYQAGVKAPSITVLDSGREDSSVLTTMYRYYDEANMMSLADISDNGQYEKVYFTVRDINFINGTREMTSHAYYHVDGVAGTETISVGGEEISVNSLVDLIYDPDTDGLVDATKLVSGKIYYLLIPRTVMNQCENGLDIYFEAWSKITTNTTKKNEYETDKVYAKLKVLRAYLFELD